MKSLPAPETTGKMSVEETIAKRRSVRSFVDEKLSDEQVSQLLWAAQGITLEPRGLRAAPSAGATYPLETYVVCQDGLFRYVPDKHALEKLKDGDLRGALSGAALGQQCVADAPVSIVFTAIPERTTKRYGERGRMYIHMEAGHAAENIHLQAVAMGLGSVPVGAFDDGKMAELLGVSAPEIPLYIISIGKPRGR